MGRSAYLSSGWSSFVISAWTELIHNSIVMLDMSFGVVLHIYDVVCCGIATGACE